MVYPLFPTSVRPFQRILVLSVDPFLCEVRRWSKADDGFHTKQDLTTHKVQGNSGTKFSRFSGCRVGTETSSETPTKCRLLDPYKNQSVQHRWNSEKPKNAANEHQLDVARVPGRCVRWAMACPGCKFVKLFWDSGVGRSMFERILKDEHSCRAAAETGTGARQANPRATTKMNEQWSNRPYSRSSVYVVSATRAIGSGVIHRRAARESQ